MDTRLLDESLSDNRIFLLGIVWLHNWLQFHVQALEYWFHPTARLAFYYSKNLNVNKCGK